MRLLGRTSLVDRHVTHLIRVPLRALEYLPEQLGSLFELKNVGQSGFRTFLFVSRHSDPKGAVYSNGVVTSSVKQLQLLSVVTRDQLNVIGANVPVLTERL